MIYIAILFFMLIFLVVARRRKKMPQGLQVYNESGRIILDYTENTNQIYGKTTVVGGVAGSVSNQRIKANETFIIPYNIRLVGGSGSEYYRQFLAVAPCFTISNGRISWEFASKHSQGAYIEMDIYYGGSLN